MTYKKENMVKFKEFLDSHGMFEYFCKAFLDSEIARGYDFPRTTYSIINSFDWGRADRKYTPPVEFGTLDHLWCQIYDNDSATQKDRGVFIQELKSLDKTRALLRAIRMSHD